MKTSSIIIALVALFSVPGCTTPQDRSTIVGSAQLTSSDGEPAGSADLFVHDNQLMISVAASGLDEGAHGFHLHTTGACDAPDFGSAGGHLDPNDNLHGRLTPGGSHLGDLPNVEAGADGTATATAFVSDDPSAALEDMFDADGTAVIIHAKADDYRTQPSGAAGKRVICGVLRRN